MPDPTHRGAQSPDRRSSRRGALAENTETSLSLPLVEITGAIQRRLARPIESEGSNSCSMRPSNSLRAPSPNSATSLQEGAPSTVAEWRCGAVNRLRLDNKAICPESFESRVSYESCSDLQAWRMGRGPFTSVLFDGRRMSDA